MKILFTPHLLMMVFIPLFSSHNLSAEVSKKQLIDYIVNITYKNYKELGTEEKLKATQSIEQNYNSKTLPAQQKLDLYCILLIDIGLDKPEASSFKAIMLYQIEKYDLQHPEEPLYILPKESFIYFVNACGENMIYKKVGIQKTAEDLRLEKMGAYSKKKEIPESKRIQAINDIYQDYVKMNIKMDEYKKAALQSFANL